MLGCGLPGGEQGYNMARVVAVLLGLDHLPGRTVTRYCSSSLQTTRMALHAIKAGEGDVFISAGVETVSAASQGQRRRPARTPQNPLVRRGHRPRERAGPRRRRRRRGLARPRARTALLPDVYIAMGQTAENVAAAQGRHPRRPGRIRRRARQNLAEKAIANGFWDTEITPVTLPDGTVVTTDDGPRAGVTLEAVSGPRSRSSAPTAPSPPATAAR